ncbi:MAG: ABC transporter ATP-binding protein [Candidatus Polarisedimenticolia bacterium]
MSSAIDVTHLQHRFGDRVALSDVSFTVPRGQMAALLGPNGGGKTTLFRILATLLRPGGGDAGILGHSVSRDPDGVRRCLGVVFQSPSLDRMLTTRENLRHHGMLHGLHGALLESRLAEALDLVRLTDRAHERAGQLSGGLQRRAELAKSLMHRPDVLLLDEPSTGLDPGARRDFLGHLATLAEGGVTVLLTTHFMEEAERCQWAGILHEGRLVAWDSPDRLKASIGGDVVMVRGKDPQALAGKVRERFGLHPTWVDGTLRYEAEAGHRLAAALVDAFPDDVTSVTWGRPTLEDVFTHLTGRTLSEAAA